MNPTIDFLVNFKGDATGFLNAVNKAEAGMKKLYKENQEMAGLSAKDKKAYASFYGLTDPNVAKKLPQYINPADPDQVNAVKKAFSKQRAVVMAEIDKTLTQGEKITWSRIQKLNAEMAHFTAMGPRTRRLLPEEYRTRATAGSTTRMINDWMGGGTQALQKKALLLNDLYFQQEQAQRNRIDEKRAAMIHRSAAKRQAAEEVAAQKVVNANYASAARVAKAEETAQARYNLKVSGNALSPFAPQLGMWDKFKQGVSGWFGGGIGSIMKSMAGIYSLYAIFNKISSAVRYLATQTIELQLSFARLNALALVGGVNYGRLKDTVFALGTAHGFLATETVTAIKPLIQMGQTTEEIATITKRAMQVANITGESLTEIINVMVSVMATYNIKAQEAADLYAYWGSLASKFSVTIPMIAKGFEQAGDTFKDFGFTAKEVSAVMAVLMEGERGRLPGIIRFLRLMMENMAASAEDIQKFMGVSVLDVTGAVRPGYQVLQDMAAAWSTMTGAQKTNLAQGMKNKSMLEGLRAVMNSWGDVQEAINLGLATGNDLLAKQSAIVENTLIKQWTSLKNIWVEIASDKSEGLVGYLGKVLVALQNMSLELAKPGWGKFWDILSNGQPLENAINSRGKWLDWMLPSGQQQTLARNKYGYGASGSWADIPLPGTEGEITGGGNKASGKTTDEMRAQWERAQVLRSWAKTGYDEEKKIAEDRAKANENDLKIAVLRNQMNKGYQVGINKDLQEELTKREELNNTIISTQKEINRLKQEELKADETMDGHDSEAIENAEKRKVEIVGLLSEQNVKLEEAKNALMLQETIARKLGETYRNMMLDTLVEIIEKTQTWYDLNMKVKELIIKIGDDILRKVLDKVTGGFVDAIGGLGGILTGEQNKAPAGVMYNNFAGGSQGLLALGVGGVGAYAAMQGGGYRGKDYTMIDGRLSFMPKDWQKNQAGQQGGLGWKGYAGAAMMGAAMGQNRGTKGMAGGAIGSMAGAGIGLALGGAQGAQLGALAGGWLGSLFGKPKKQDNATEEAIKSFSATPSKIDVTNNELQIVNRNLVALKEKFEPYPFRESAYFTSHMNTGIGSGQWGNNITINVNGATDPVTTANAVSKAIAGYSLQGAQA
ncbi:MAG: phage tail tape measure protein [Candidatus Izemoplasmatales bacterium]